MAKRARMVRRKAAPRPSTRSRSSGNKKLEALRRAQKIDEILRMGNIQSQAASDSAVEERPADESHIVNLLENTKLPFTTGLEEAPVRSRKRTTTKPRTAAKPKRRARR
jgi:hypothetical protein